MLGRRGPPVSRICPAPRITHAAVEEIAVHSHAIRAEPPRGAFNVVARWGRLAACNRVSEAAATTPRPWPSIDASPNMQKS